jgi:hypothetical protein
VTPQLGLRSLDLGAVERGAQGCSVSAGPLTDLEQAARAADHDVPVLDVPVGRFGCARGCG